MAVEPAISVDRELSGVLRLAAIYCDGLEIDDGEPLWAVFEPFCREIADRYAGQTISAVPGIQPARELYRAVGVDPTRHRPASEALIRRLIKGKKLYRINSLVDTVNYCSLMLMLPMGLYDLDRIEGEAVRVRTGGPGDGYAGIGKDHVNLEGRFALFDSAGPFGSPTADSERTKITFETSRALVLVFAPWNTPPAKLADHARFTADVIGRFGGGHPHVRRGPLVD